MDEGQALIETEIETLWGADEASGIGKGLWAGAHWLHYRNHTVT